MQLSEETINVLKNFASINPSIRFQEGNVIKTCSIALNVMAVSVVEDSFPKECCIYDLNQFLGLLSLFDKADIDFKDDLMIVSEVGEARGHNSKSRYVYTDEQNIVFPPDKELDVTNPIEFEISEEDYSKIVSGVSLLRVSNVVVRGKDGDISLVGTEFSDPTSNEFGLEIGSTEHDFEFVLKASNFKFVPDSYKVAISHETNVAHFKGNKVEYWVAVELDSYFNE